MNSETQALISRIASGTTTEADAEKVKAFLDAFDSWAETGEVFGDLFDAIVETREALK